MVETSREENSCVRPPRRMSSRARAHSSLPSRTPPRYYSVPNNSPIGRNGTKLISNCHTESPKATPSRITHKTVTNQQLTQFHHLKQQKTARGNLSPWAKTSSILPLTTIVITRRYYNSRAFRAKTYCDR